MKDHGTRRFRYRVTPLEKNQPPTWHECIGSVDAYIKREHLRNPVVEKREETEDGIIYREVG